MEKLHQFVGTFILLTGCLHAQPFERETSTIPVTLGNAPFPFAFTGGMSTLNHQPIHAN